MNSEQFQTVAVQMMTRDAVEVDGIRISVRRTSAHRLRTVKFTSDGNSYTAIEQNPDKPSRWGQLARDGHRVVQFKDNASNKFIAVAVDGKVKLYG